MKKVLFFLLMLPALGFAQVFPISNSTVNTCTGTFTDTGGLAGNYNNNQNIVFTICPDPANPGEVSRVLFSSFMTEAPGDVLEVYLGTNNNPANLVGSFSGTNSPGNQLGDLTVGGGCLTFRFVSSPQLTQSGWEAAISCSPPCQSVNAVFDSSDPPVDPTENVILACPDVPVTFNGSGVFSNPGGGVGATYEWFFSDGTSLMGQTVMKPFTTGGYYDVDLVVTDVFGCESMNDIGIVVQVDTVPDFTGTMAADASICQGDTTVLTGVVTPTPFAINCTIPISGVTALPDGLDEYFTCIPVSCFGANDTVQDVSDILEICANMEHSFIGDLDVFIVAPDGTEVLLFDGTPQGGTNLGAPLQTDDANSPGTGFDYCFDEVNGTTILVNGNTEATTTDEGGTTIEAGVYLPEESFNALIGVPLNGDWCLKIVDTLLADNGFIFSWFINFNPAIIPSGAGFTPNIVTQGWDPDPTIQAVVGNSIVVEGQTVGQQCYNYTVTDDFGCTFTEQVCIDVLPTPVANDPQDILQCDDGTQFGNFDLTENDDDVLLAQDPALFNITYHNSQADADAGMPMIATPANYAITGTSEIIFVRIEDVSGACFDTNSFEIQFLPVDILDPITPLLLCDDDADGIVLVNIPAQKDTEVLDGQDPANYTITYHETQADANADVNPLPVPYNAPAPGQQIFARIENNTQNIGVCFLTGEFTLGIFEAPPATEPTLLAICDESPNDGFAVFDLTVKDNEITSGNPDAEVVYYESLMDAQTNNAPINPADNYTNSMAGFQTLFARVQNVNNPDCFNIVELDIQVDNAPAIADPISPYFLCDNDEDFVETFDLTTKDDEIENGLVNVTTEYYDTLADAEAGMNPIPNPTMYSSGNNQVFAVVTNSLGCQTIGEFSLIIGLVPEYDVPTPFEQCDLLEDGTEDFDLNEKNDEILNGASGLSVTYYGNQADAESANAPLPIPYTSMGGEIVWVRIEDDITGCYGVEQMELVVVPLPDIFPPDPLVFCDIDNDGIGEFTLQDASDQIRGGNPSGNLIVTYHPTPADAVNAQNEITDVPYLNVTPFMDSVYARLTDLDTGCFDTVELVLIVGNSPVINEPNPLQMCDDDGDGVEIFNLTLSEPDIFSGNPSGTFIVDYYEFQANADSETNPIVNETVYPNQLPLTVNGVQTIFVVVTDTDNGCTTQTTLDLVVNLMPALTTPDPIILCDTDEFGPLQEAFDLTTRINQITGGDASIQVMFYETMSDLVADTPVADPSAFVNTISNPQDVFIRATDVNTGCVEDSVTLTIEVQNAPSLTTPDPLVVCDDNNDGFGFFTLTDAEAQINNGEPNVVYSYYETLLDAQNAFDPIDISMPYENFIQFMQTVFVRGEYNDATMCFSIVELELQVIDSPVIPLPGTIDPIILCDENMDGFEIFDLTQVTDEIYGTQDQTDFTLTFHEQLADAQAGSPQIVNPGAYQNLTPTQTIFYRLDNDDSANFCASIGSFEIQVVDGPTIIDPTPYTLCDDIGESNDGFAEFDLTTKSDEITAGVPGLNVTYYEVEQDAIDNVNQIAPATNYTNTTATLQLIYVRVFDSNSGCVAFTTLQLRVEPNPQPNTPTALQFCDIDESGTEEGIDLTQVEGEVTGGSPWVLSYFLTYDDAFNDVNAIMDPTAFDADMTPFTVFIRVQNNNSAAMCFEIVTLTININDLPDGSQPVTDLIVCEIPNDGAATFDLTLKDAEVLGPDQPSPPFEVSYYETQADADAMINPIVPANMYSVDTMGGLIPIFTGILNTETGCYNVGQSFNLETREGATATAPAEPYTLCDAEGDNDGFTSFDLSDPDLLAEILNGQDPAIYIPTFHETFETADAGTNAIGPDYTNIINPQIIYVRVTNSQTDCYDIAEVILNVVQLPFVSLDEEYRLCVDANGNPLMEDFGLQSPPVLEIFLDNPELFEIVWTLDGAELEGENGTSIIAVQGGTYEVTITEISTGCTASTSAPVSVSGPPEEFSARLVNGAFSGDNTIEILVEGVGDYVFSVDGSPFQESNMFSGLLPGSRIITIQDANGCGMVEFKFGIIDFDNFFTPNEDGFNDLWQINEIASFDDTANIYIFDRYGKLLKQLSPLSLGWDGTYNGSPLPSSDYWFLLEYTEDGVRKEFRNHFTLKR